METLRWAMLVVLVMVAAIGLWIFSGGNSYQNRSAVVVQGPDVTLPLPPTSLDDDDDGVADAKDRCPGTPRGIRTDAGGCPVAQAGAGRPGPVGFGPDSAELTQPAKEGLDSFAEALRAQPGQRIEIVGHADGTETPSDAMAQALSERRATSVKNYLIARGISPQQLRVAAYGETQPKESNETDAGRTANRRVELQVTSAPPTPIPPPPVATPAPSDPQIVDNLLAPLRTAAILYDAPLSIQQGSYAVFTVQLQPQAKESDLRKQRQAESARTAQAVESTGTPAKAGGGASDETRRITTGKTRISNYVTASLVGAGIDVAAPADISQLVSNSEVTHFNWIVVARNPGRHSLTFTLTTQFDVGGSKPYRLKTAEFDILVKPIALKTRARDWVNNNLQWIWTTFVLPLIVFVWNEIKLRMKSGRKEGAGASTG
ncbi:OmpA family protein [Solimonas sp. K1W22B-7]|uniref:OmpA family protein n=1 Tax=Solimonas sp. K1W22B-7 TaxID=2303331 RepID=UPI000E32D9E3|nr:OmpA family protein [Solimonas sp. K1W22B-7]AXQ30631.1 OmpA family protein [Solimonas sp. K1W22B-7]